MKYVGYNTLLYFWLKMKAKFAEKYDKAGGEITGNVVIDGNLTLDIDDPDYDSGITFTKSLDTNAGTVLSLNGYANGNENTNYRPVIRNVANPINNYDVANKQYVDSQVVRPKSYLVLLANDGTIDTVTATLTYSAVKSELTNPTTDVFLDVLYNSSRIHIPAMQDQDTNAGPIVFLGEIRMSNGDITEAVFLLDSSDNLTVNYTLRENALLKTNDIVSNATSASHYPSTKAVYDQFQRKPVEVWRAADSASCLKALQADLSASPAWQLTGLDMTSFKRIKVYSKAGKGSTNASTTSGMVLEMSLDPTAASAAFGGNYCGSVLSQKPNDANRYASLTCAVSADKTKFAVLRQTSLYGTAATTNNDIGADVFLIEGYYD